MLNVREPDLLSPAEFVLLAVVAMAALAGLVATFVRPVPRGQGVLVTRAGGTRRSHSQGVVLVLPLIDRVVRVSLRPTTIEPLVVRGRTADGVRTVVTATAVIRLVELDRAVDALPSVTAYAADAIERRMADAISRLELAELTDPAARSLRALVRERDRALSEVGVVVDWFGVDAVEVTADEGLLSWADARTADEHASRR